LGAVEESSAHAEAGQVFEGMVDESFDEGEEGARHTLSRTLPDTGGDVDSTASTYSPPETIHVKSAGITRRQQHPSCTSSLRVRLRASGR
jgi:hypothetical protein